MRPTRWRVRKEVKHKSGNSSSLNGRVVYCQSVDASQRVAATVTNDYQRPAPSRAERLLRTAVSAVSELMEIDENAMELAFTLRTVSNSLFADLHQRLRSAEASSPRVLNTLLVIIGLGEVHQGDLAELNDLSKAGVSHLVEEMVQAGLIERRSVPGDRRSVLLGITALGREAFLRDFQIFHDGEVEWMSALEDAERTELLRLLVKLQHSNPALPG